jgi:hypothetical protein
MTETQSFIIDVFKIVPDEAVCFIQAPSIDNAEFQKLMRPSEFPYFQQITLTPSNKEHLSSLVKIEHVEESFHNLEIRHNGNLLFEGFDGMEIGAISKEMQLPSSFINKYINSGVCTISKEW